MKAVKIDDDAYKLIEDISNKTKASITELVTRAIKIVYGSEETSKEVTSYVEKIISLKYPATCRRCSKQLSEADLAAYVKYVFSDNTTKTVIYCLDCYHETRITDKTLAKLYLKKKELERTVKALKAEADRITKEILDTKTISELINYLHNAKTMIDTIIREAMSKNYNVDTTKLEEAMMNIDKLISQTIMAKKLIEERVHKHWTTRTRV